MSSLSNTTNMTIRIDKNFKKEMDNLFKNLGINTTSAIMMFLKQCEREQGIPFNVTMEVPNKRLISALEESEDIINGKVKSKRYNDFAKFLNKNGLIVFASDLRGHGETALINNLPLGYSDGDICIK